MKLFKQVIEQRLRSYLEGIGVINKYQSGLRQNKPTDDHLFRHYQSVMESFNRGENVESFSQKLVPLNYISVIIYLLLYNTCRILLKPTVYQTRLVFFLVSKRQ